MVTPTDLGAWLSLQARPLGILFGILILTYVALKASAWQRRRTLTQQREGVTEDSFAEYLAEFGLDPAISRSTYRYLQQVQNVQYPILPSDTLEDLGLDPDDVEQTVRDLCTALQVPKIAGLSQVHTVHDLVRMLHAAAANAGLRSNAA